MSAQLADARAALDARDLYLAHQRLDVLLATISASTLAQRTSEGYGLMYFNVKAIIESTTRPPAAPKVRHRRCNARKPYRQTVQVFLDTTFPVWINDKVIILADFLLMTKLPLEFC